MAFRSHILKYVLILITFSVLVSCDSSIVSNVNASDYALKNSENFKDVKGFMVYAHMDTHLTYMELHLRNLHTGKDETLLSSKNTEYSTMMPISITADGHLIFVNAHKPNTKNTFMLLYNLNKRTYKELDVAHSAIAGDISPDKTKLVFYSDFNDQHNYSIYISDLNGKNLVKIPCLGVSCMHPSWSNDGEKIIYILESRKIYEYDIKSKQQKIIFKLKNKRKYRISYPVFYKNNIYFSKTRKRARLSVNNNSEILKISNNKITSFVKSNDKLFALSFLSDAIYLSDLSSNKALKKYAKIEIHNITNNASFSLTTSNIRKFQNSSPYFFK